MALFGKKKESDKMSTLDEFLKEYEKLSDEDKKTFHQTLKDRIDEGVGEEEALHGDKDSQTADERIDEAVGEKLADDEEKDEDEHGEDMESEDVDGESMERAEEETEAKTGDDAMSNDEIKEMLTKFDARLSALEKAKESEEFEEIGTDDDFMDEAGKTARADYMAMAKKMRS